MHHSHKTMGPVASEKAPAAFQWQRRTSSLSYTSRDRPIFVRSRATPLLSSPDDISCSNATAASAEFPSTALPSLGLSASSSSISSPPTQPTRSSSSFRPCDAAAKPDSDMYLPTGAAAAEPDSHMYLPTGAAAAVPDAPVRLPTSPTSSAAKRVSSASRRGLSLPSWSSRLSAPCDKALAYQKKVERQVLSYPRELWPLAAQHFREELAALRSIKEVQHVAKQNYLAKQNQLQQYVCYDEEDEKEEQEGKRQDAKQKLEAVGHQQRAGTEVKDREWSPEEVELLWQGKKIRKLKKPPDLLDPQKLSRWDLLQRRVKQLKRSFRKRLEWSYWWETCSSGSDSEKEEEGDEEAEKHSEMMGAVTVEKEHEREEETEEEEDERLPVFGYRSMHKKENLLKQVRPVWRPKDGLPLHCETGLPQYVIKASVAVAPPTSDEVRRLLFYPEEVERRKIQDRTLFETAGELQRQRYWKLWEQFVRQQQQQPEQEDRDRRREEGGFPSLLEGERSSNADFGDVLEEDSSSRGRRASHYSMRARERGDTPASLEKDERLHKTTAAAAAYEEASTTPLPSPPRWLLPPHQRKSQKPRAYGDNRRRREFKDVATAAGGRKDEAATTAAATAAAEVREERGRGKGSTRRRVHCASPGGALDQELVILKAPREGWRWTIEDRDRWKRSMLLRRAMKNNQLVFAADLEERQYAADFERFMRKPFIPPRADWGGYDYYAAAEDDKKEAVATRSRRERRRGGEERRRRGGGEERRRRRGGGEEGDGFDRKEWITAEAAVGDREDEETAAAGGDDEEAAVLREKAWREAFVAVTEREKQQQEKRREEANIAEQIDKLQRNQETRLEKLCEVLEGNIPSPFDNLPFPARKKHPKDCTVPSTRLRAYGEMIDKITNCTFLQVDMQQALSEGWRYTQVHFAGVKHVPLPKGIPPDIYCVTAEKLREASAKLAPEAEEVVAFAIARPQRVEHIQEPEKVLGGGRYSV